MPADSTGDVRVLSGVCAVVFSGIAALCAWHAHGVDRNRRTISNAPGFRSVAELRQAILRQAEEEEPGAGGVAGHKSIYASLDAFSASNQDGPNPVILRDHSVTEQTETWRYSPPEPPQPQTNAASPPGGAAPAPPPAAPSSGTWSRSETSRTISSRSANREARTLLLTDAQRDDFVTVSPHTVQHCFDNSTIWTRVYDEITHINDPSSTPPIANMLLSAVAASSHAEVPPRVLKRLKHWRELRSGESLFALGEFSLEHEGERDHRPSLTFSVKLQSGDSRPTALKSGSRQSELAAMEEDSRGVRQVGWVFGGFGLTAALIWIANFRR